MLPPFHINQKKKKKVQQVSKLRQLQLQDYNAPALHELMYRAKPMQPMWNELSGSVGRDGNTAAIIDHSHINDNFHIS